MLWRWLHTIWIIFFKIKIICKSERKWEVYHYRSQYTLFCFDQIVWKWYFSAVFILYANQLNPIQSNWLFSVEFIYLYIHWNKSNVLFPISSNAFWCWSAFHLYTLHFPLLSQSANLCYFVIAHVCLSFVCSFLPLFLFLSISFLLAVSSSYNAYSGWCFYIFCCCADE